MPKSSLETVHTIFNTVPRRPKVMAPREVAKDRFDAFVEAVLAKVSRLSGRIFRALISRDVGESLFPKVDKLVAGLFFELGFCCSQLALKVMDRRLKRRCALSELE